MSDPRGGSDKQRRMAKLYGEKTVLASPAIAANIAHIPNVLSVLPKARAALPPVDFQLLTSPPLPSSPRSRPSSGSWTASGRRAFGAWRRSRRQQSLPQCQLPWTRLTLARRRG